MADLVHPEISGIMNGQLRPQPLYRTRRGHARHAIRGVTTSSLALVDALEGEEPTLGGKDGEGGGRHEKIFSVTIPAMGTIIPTDKLILANRAELERWDVYNKHPGSILFLSSKGAANSFLVRVAGRSDSR